MYSPIDHNSLEKGNRYFYKQTSNRITGNSVIVRWLHTIFKGVEDGFYTFMYWELKTPGNPEQRIIRLAEEGVKKSIFH